MRVARWGGGNAEAGAEVVEERDDEFRTGLGGAEHDVARLPSFSLTVPPEILRLVTKARMSFSEALVLSRDVRPLEDAQEFVLAPEQAFQQMVESRVAGPALEDAVEAGAQLRGAFEAWASL